MNWSLLRLTILEIPPRKSSTFFLLFFFLETWLYVTNGPLYRISFSFHVFSQRLYDGGHIPSFFFFLLRVCSSIHILFWLLFIRSCITPTGRCPSLTFILSFLAFLYCDLKTENLGTITKCLTFVFIKKISFSFPHFKILRYVCLCLLGLMKFNYQIRCPFLILIFFSFWVYEKLILYFRYTESSISIFCICHLRIIQVETGVPILNRRDFDRTFKILTRLFIYITPIVVDPKESSLSPQCLYLYFFRSHLRHYNETLIFIIKNYLSLCLFLHTYTNVCTRVCMWIRDQDDRFP